MTYAQKDRSVHDGEPIEVYKFTGPFGNFLYTSNNEPITVDGDEYEPLPITRTAVETGSVVDTIVTMDFIIPSTTPLAKLYAYTLSPQELKIEVKRVHRGDDYSTEFVVEWIGEVTGYSSSGNWTTINTGSLFQSRLNGNVSTVYYQGICNHILYDIRCKAVRANHTSQSTITKIQLQQLTVENDGYANGELIGGEMVNTRTGERRFILDNTDNIVLVGYAFIDLIEGDTVTMTQGCDHARLGDCKNRFNNVANYGGFDFIPVENPFSDLQPIDQVTTAIRSLEVELQAMITGSIKQV